MTLRQHTLMKLHEHICLYVIKANFYGISQLCHINLDQRLIAILVEQ